MDATKPLWALAALAAALLCPPAAAESPADPAAWASDPAGAAGAAGAAAGEAAADARGRHPAAACDPIVLEGYWPTIDWDCLPRASVGGLPPATASAGGTD